MSGGVSGHADGEGAESLIDPRVVDVRVIMQVGDDERDWMILDDTSLMASTVLIDGNERLTLSTDDVIASAVSALIGLGERLCQQSGSRFSTGMPDFLRYISNALPNIQYDEGDDARQDVIRSTLGLPPIDPPDSL